MRAYRSPSQSAPRRARELSRLMGTPDISARAALTGAKRENVPFFRYMWIFYFFVGGTLRLRTGRRIVWRGGRVKHEGNLN